MKTKLFKSFLLFCWIFTSACSNNPAKLAENMDFLTRISDSGLKHFELREKRMGPPRLQPAPVVNGASGRAKPISKNNFDRKLKTYHKVAKSVIEENQYCKEGFWVLDADIDFRGPYLRGECNDLASEDDRTQFPDSLTNW